MDQRLKGIFLFLIILGQLEIRTTTSSEEFDKFSLILSSLNAASCSKITPRDPLNADNV